MRLVFLLGILFVIIIAIFAAPMNYDEEDGEECVDKSEYCKHMKQNCFDIKYEKLMKTQCRLTCNFCESKPDLFEVSL